jgi:hypothetical protein
MDGKKCCKKGEEVAKEGEKGLFYSRGQVLSGSLARLGTTRASALDAGSQQEHAHLVFRQPTRDLGTS